MNFTRDQKIDILLIVISTISVIASFVLSLDYIAWVAVLLCGVPIFKECAEGLITEFDIKADLLVTIAIIASIIIGEVFAAGEIATIMAIGGFLEEYTVSKAQGQIEELVRMTPQLATRIRNGIEEKIAVEKVEIGDILKVLPGESIPTDGIIVEGETSIDQSTLTGESLPVDKKVNDEVYSGTINLYGSFNMKTTKISEDSALQPCALVLATPTAIMAAVGNLTKHGILVKDGQSLEELAHVNEIVFDKTGTLTHGTPKVVEVISDDDEMMYLLASLESKSDHPLAKAIVSHYDGDSLANAENFEMKIGKGVTDEPQNGEIQIFVAKDSEVIGKVILADTLRESSRQTVKRLKCLGVGTTLLTGDNEQAGKFISKQVKVSNARFNCLPEDKTEYIGQEQLKGSKVAMIGDGINDAPSLRKANVGIAMGSVGSDVSIEAANIALINDNIEEVPHLVGIARKTFSTINLNIAFSLTLNIIAMILAVLGVLGPIAGALVHNIGSVIVIIYSSTLINYKLSRKDYNKAKKAKLSFY